MEQVPITNRCFIHKVLGILRWKIQRIKRHSSVGVLGEYRRQFQLPSIIFRELPKPGNYRGRLSYFHALVVKKLQGSRGQRVNRQRVAFAEPKIYSCVELCSRSRFVSHHHAFGRQSRFVFFGWRRHLWVRLTLAGIAAASAVCSQGFAQRTDTPSQGKTSLPVSQALEILHAAPCNLDKNILVRSYASKDLNGYQTCQSALRFLSLARALWALVGAGEDRSPTIPIGLPAALISCTLTGALHSRMLARHAPETGQKHRDISSLQRTRITLQALSLGFLLAALSAVAEVSFRYLLE